MIWVVGPTFNLFLLAGYLDSYWLHMARSIQKSMLLVDAVLWAGMGVLCPALIIPHLSGVGHNFIILIILLQFKKKILHMARWWLCNIDGLKEISCFLYGEILFFIFVLNQTVLFNLHQLGEGKYCQIISWAFTITCVQASILQSSNLKHCVG